LKVLHLDSNHDILAERLNEAGFENYFDYDNPVEDVLRKIGDYDGVIIRSRIPVDATFLEAASSLKFIGRVGAGMENIDLAFAKARNIKCYNSPEGNMNAVGEHALGMLLTLFNKINKADQEVRKGIWDREGNRGLELEGKTVGIIGYGNMGRSFARKLSGFDCEVICHDILPDKSDDYANQVSLEELMERSQVISLHTPQTELTIGMINADFIASMKNPFYLINTARGKSVITADLVTGLDSGKVLGAGLDVLEQEKSSFSLRFCESKDFNTPLQKLIGFENVILSPHIAGWSVESKFKLANVIADKILNDFT
jgi:D-3-phosphoglycerate dehydrogenase